MIPSLHLYLDSDFDTMGIGSLPDAISCTVTEELNGMYELDMEYPNDGIRAYDLLTDRIICAQNNPWDHPQPFRIYSVQPSLAGTTLVKAGHISYQLSSVMVAPFISHSAIGAMRGLGDHAVGNNPFTFSTDIVKGSLYSQKVPASIRARLTEDKDCILATYGGELEYDRYSVALKASRGANNGVVVAYGKNLIDYNQELNNQNLLTAIYPYYYKDNTLVQLPERLVSVSNPFSFPRTKAVDLTSQFDAAPTEADLRAAAQAYIDTNQLTTPVVSIKASFIPLEQTEEYRDIAPLEKVRLGDTVTVRYLALDVDATAKVVRVVYDVLQDRYTSVELGSAWQTLDMTIANLEKGMMQ